MTAEDMLDEIDTCRGPCGKLCLSCPDGWYLKEIKSVIVGLMEERDRLRKALQEQTGEVDII